MNRKGFSLIEVIIAFSILTITVLASTNLISSSIQSNQENILRVQAYFLAQEGLELTRAYRDTQWLEGKEFLTNTGINRIEFKAKEQINLEASKDTALALNDENQYTHSNAKQDSKFKREIQISEISKIEEFEDLTGRSRETPEDFDINKKSKLVTSKVTYKFNGQDKNITLQTILTDWKPL
jgi:prepilin-type N-terminal cleavage/methylation domain-containing protein